MDVQPLQVAASLQQVTSAWRGPNELLWVVLKEGTAVCCDRPLSNSHRHSWLLVEWSA
jgi:hypothetical protein